MASKADFQLAYDGEALRDHSMDVDELAPALLAVGNLCREANRILNGDKAEVAVRVRADFERRCFDIHFELVQSLFEQVKTLLADDRVETAKTILEWIGLLGPAGALSLFGFLRLRDSRPVRSTVKIEESHGNTIYNITFEGEHNSVTVPEPVYLLANDPRISKATREIVRPLRADGISTLEIRQGDHIVDKITKTDADAFYAEPLTTEVGLSVQIIDAILTLRAPVFVSGAKWDFFFGDQRLSAEITDTRFLTRVFVDGERFGAGDKLHVKLRLSQYQTPAGQIRNNYEVLDVMKIWPRGQQIALEFGSKA